MPSCSHVAAYLCFGAVDAAKGTWLTQQQNRDIIKPDSSLKTRICLSRHKLQTKH
jgi:hypothetical protein